MMRLRDKYKKEVMSKMKDKFNYQNDLAVPRIEKVVINIGVNPATRDEKAQAELANDLALITGQKLSSRQARKAEAGFKIRQGMIVGLACVLRKQRMWDFLDRLINVALPRGRDFRGLLEKNVDKAGNLNIGIKEQIIFPEISADNVKSIFGFQITVKTAAKSREEALELYRLLGFPLRS